ncbi:MAG TPA: uroporphyrinogen decarboxylase family protein [Phycisphaerae bacterium]|jgi:uroporphyrinogen decarboxylase|nr:uroporphyrinogen-III decarboxylase-like protein [Phycisphaerae bacterium]HOB73459.1 uroporphyrinogen decarboxylase family protein [Phycisphaerae bacterium]HOJ55986.1 uroporphyrinogen decarboxylase family protein [Phycisphaerae bacterium]HOL25640.1 uroporphyrinogen decarboxylase family protein [Phycisphaerae bacterium]HPP22102.1 uroporphyrinogen decarboxylase family protein [Phycisphaerae bacterium]
MTTSLTDRVGHLPKPQPDVQRIKTALSHGQPDRVPLAELAIAEEVMAELGGPLPPLPANPTGQQLREWAQARVGLWWRLGYDYYRVRVEIPFTVDRLPAVDTANAQNQRQWVNEHDGIIHTLADVERYTWPGRADMGLSQAEAALACLPEGMGAIGFSGGVLEWTTALMGLERFMMCLYDEPELARTVVDRVGAAILQGFELLCEMDAIFALWLGDDMGFKTATLASPEHLREYILPWHKRYAELAHRTGRLFLLHSCGHVEAIMPDLIADVGIDAKHSFEDVIMPVEEFHRRWGGKVGVMGGVDVDLLSRKSEEEVRERTLQILEACAPAGGYSCGSGNSVTNYVPARNYLAMVETVHRFNGRL